MFATHCRKADEVAYGTEADLCILRNAFFAWLAGLWASPAFAAISYHFVALNVLKGMLKKLDYRFRWDTALGTLAGP